MSAVSETFLFPVNKNAKKFCFIFLFFSPGFSGSWLKLLLCQILLGNFFFGGTDKIFETWENKVKKKTILYANVL